MKSKLTLILALLALWALMALPVQAESAAATATPAPTVLSGSGWSYDNGVLTITANISDYNLASSRSDWFIGTPFERAGIDHTTTEIIVAEGVTSLGDLAFYGFSNLTKVTFPDTLTYIGSDTFRNCGALTEITIPASVTGMGNDAFGLSHLTKITFEGKPPKLGTWSGYYDGTVSIKAFSGASGQVYYPPYNAWTSSAIANYSSSAYLTWNKVYSSTGTAGPNATWYLLYDGTLVISGTGDLNGYTRSNAPWRSQLTYIKDYDVASGITFNYTSGNTPKLSTGVSSIAMGPGGTMDLTGQFSVDASFLMQDDYTLTIADESVATISGHVLTAVNYGRTTLTVAAKDHPELTVVIPVLVADEAESITLPTRLYAGVGTAIQLTATTSPASAAQGLIWSLADSSLADIDGDLLTVTATAAGSTTVTASSWNGVTASTTLHIYVPTVSKVTLTAIPAYCGVGDTLQLTATVRDNIRTYENQLVSFTSSDEAVATVDEKGLVTFLTTGTVTFTAESANGKSSTVTTTVLNHTETIEAVSLPELFVGEKAQAAIIAAVPETALDTLTWSSADDSIATVDANGLVTAVGAGTTQIIATAWDGMTAEADITVHSPIEAISIDEPEQPYYILDTLQLTARVQCEEEFVNRFVTWESSDPDIVSVDENGLANLNSYGSATITATTANGLKAEITITIRMEIWDFLLAQNGDLYQGGTCQMKVVNLDPEDADPGITWTSSDPAIFTVDENGLLTGVSEGMADITATAWNGLARSLTIIVNPPCEHPEIVIDAAVEPTDSTTGLTEGSHCATCNQVFVAQEVIPANFTVEDGVLVAYNGGQTNVVIPDNLGITKIDSSVFFYNTDLISLVIPEGTTEIDHNAFVGCHALESVHLPSTMRTIDGDAFLGCLNLTSINLPEGLTSLGSSCFQDCENLAPIVLPDSLTTIGENCFYHCLTLTSITLPNNLQTIGNNAFYGCGSLTAINLGCISAVRDELIAQGHESKLVTIHDEQPAPAVDPTCVTDGLTEGSACADCGEVFIAQEIVPATGHTPITDAAVEPTDYTTGLTVGNHCDVCGEVIVAQEVIPANFTVENGVLVAYNGGKTDVVIPADLGITKIGGWLFNEDTELTSIVIPEGVTTLGPNAFCFCTALTSVSLPESLTHIEYSAFEMCYSLYDLTLPSQLVSIGSEAFSSSGIRNVTLPATLRELGVSAFAMCQNLTYIAIPEGVTTLPASLFASCLYLREVSLPSTLTTMGSEVFKTCNALTTINLSCISAATETLIAEGHESKLVFIHDEQPLPAVDATCVSDGLTVGSACADCDEVFTAQEVVPAFGHTPVTDDMVDVTCTTDGLTEGSHCETCGEILVAQETIFAIGHIPVTDEANAPTCTEDGLTAGSHCEVCGIVIVAQEVDPATGHNEIIDEAVPSTDTTPGLTEGSHCDRCGLVFVAQEEIPAGYTIENGVLTGCSLTDAEIIIPGDLGITKIGNNVFRECTTLTSVVIPEGVTAIGEYAFVDCTALESVTLPSTLKTIDADAFMHCMVLTEIIIPEGVTTIGASAFHACYDLEKITLPSTLESIGDAAFFICESLTEIILPEGITEIGEYTFSSCRALTEIVIPEGVTTLGTEAFSASALEKVTLPSTLQSIGRQTFTSCGINEITLPASITSVGKNAFDADIRITCDIATQGAMLNASCTDSDRGYYLIDSAHPDYLFDLFIVESIEKLILYGYLGTDTVIYLPEEIGGYPIMNAIMDWTALETVYIPDCYVSLEGDCNPNMVVVSSWDAYARTWAVENSLTWRHDVHTVVIDEGCDATCTEDGLTEGSHCEVCGEIIVAQEVIPANGHTAVIDEAVEPACEETGLTEGSHCSVCEETLVAQEVVNALGHDWQNGEILVEPTCTSTGLRELICANDPSHISDRVILAIPHTEVIDPGVNATCLAPGLTVGSHCEVCGEVLSEQVEIPIIPHREDTMYVAPTCTEPGEGGTYCLDCGTFTWGPEEIPPLGHGYNVTNTVDATCTEEGFRTYVCNEWNGHEYGCGDTYTEVIPTTGHNVVIDAAVPPTCTEDGLSEGSHCSVCDEILIPQSVASATGHTTVIDEAVEVTCTTDGLTEGSHCEVCDEVFVEQEVVPAGHNEVIIVITDPTCTEDGMAARICERCSEISEYIPIPAGHIEVTIPQVEPTCNLIGLTEKVYCDRCGEVFKDHEAIPAIPHTEVIDPYIPATDTESGLTEGSHCGVCGQVIVAQEVIPARFTVENGVLVGARVDGPELVIPLTLRITKIGSMVFYANDVLTSVVIPEGVTEIGEAAFVECSALEKVSLPSTLVKVDDMAFLRCPALNEINLPDSLKTIGRSAFEMCTSLSEIAIPEGVTEIANSTFTNCTSLEDITLPNSLKTIGTYAFDCCYSLEEIIIPEGVTTINSKAFTSCTELQNITLPASVTTVGENAFSSSTRIICDVATQGKMVAEACAESSGYYYYLSDHAYPDFQVMVDLTKDPVQMYLYDYIGSETKVALPAEVGCYPINRTALIVGWYKYDEVYIPDSYTHLGDADNPNMVVVSSWDAYARTWAEENGLTWRHDVHTEEIIPAVDATQNENGLGEGVKCAQCGVILVEQEIIPAGKHTVVIKQGVAPTCTEDGFTEWSYCSICGEVFKTQEVIPASDEHHTWINGTLTSAPSGDAAGEMTYTCQRCGEVKTTSVVSGQPGDANQDGSVDMLDVIDMMEWYCGGAVELNLSNADVNDDGIVDMLDILLTLSWYCGWDVELK